MQMRSWKLAPSYVADALIESFVRLSIPQPHSLIGQLLQAPRKTRLQNPYSEPCLRLDPDVCLLNGESGKKARCVPDASTRLVWRLRHQHSESILARPIRKAAQYFKVISMRHETST
jgi:hypothetical protein